MGTYLLIPTPQSRGLGTERVICIPIGKSIRFNNHQIMFFLSKIFSYGLVKSYYLVKAIAGVEITKTNFCFSIAALLGEVDIMAVYCDGVKIACLRAGR